MYSNKLRFYRVQQGLTQMRLSEMTGLSIGYLSHLEKGSRNNPSVEVMEKIARALNKTVGEVFFDDGSCENEEN